MAHKKIDFSPRRDFFLGVDSDGCVFPTMEIKQKDCFHPAIMDHWSLWEAESEVRRAAEWVNLYSVHRGSNRFPALRLVFDCLREMPAFRARGLAVRETADLAAFLDSGLPLGEAGLAAWIDSGHPESADILEWSRDVNRRVAERVRKVGSFAGVGEALAAAREKADIVVVSATPEEALSREWRENGLDGAVDLIAGQEVGTKREQLESLALPHYRPGRVMMVGDAPGDLAAARAAGVLFYPVDPGREERSWDLLSRRYLALFFEGRYRGESEDGLVREFRSLLSEVPPWARGG